MAREADDTQRIASVILDEDSLGRRGPEVDHERKVAIHDLLERNEFRTVAGHRGPFSLHLGVEESRLVFDLRTADDGVCLERILLPLKPFRGLIRDYFTVLESYYQAIKTAPPSRIEAIDMGRRALHNDGSELLRERLADRVEMDLDTARALFTLICAFHARF